MTRDKDLVRDILLAVEADHAKIETGITTDQDIINHHLHLMIDGGLLNGQEVNDGQWRVYGLTWAGYELLALIGDDVRRAAIKQKLNRRSASFAIIARIAENLIE